MTLEPLAETHQALLTEALDITRCLRGRGDCAQENETFYQRQQARLKTVQTELETWRRHDIRNHAHPPNQIPLAVRQAFVRATLLAKRYHQLAGHQWQGTLPSPTLSKHIPDDIPPALATDDAIISLCQTFQLSSHDQTDLTEALQQVDQRMAHQAAIIQTVLRSVGLGTSLADNVNVHLSRIQAAALFKHLFGITLPANVVDIVYTPLQIYFCLPTDLKQLLAEVPANEHPCLIELFESMHTFSFDQFRRFPTFGPCQPQHINPAWVTPMAQQLDTSSDSIIDALSSSVSILPTEKSETFLIHDIWGHYWQLMMTQFEADYAVLGHCDEPLRAGETAYTDQGPVTCRELFSPSNSLNHSPQSSPHNSADHSPADHSPADHSPADHPAADHSPNNPLTHDEVSLDEKKAHAFFHGEVRQRLGLVFTHLIGEMMADVAEFKFGWCNPQAANELPSSSIFKAKPVKLDLSLLDLDFLFIRVINPLMKINISALETSPLEQEILASWQAQGIKSLSLELQIHLKQQLSRLHEIFLEDYRQHYLSSLKSSTGIFGQAATNLVYLQNTINHLCVDTHQAIMADLSHGSAETPLYHDLLMIFIGCFCSGDGYSNFWQMDAVLAQHFLPCWHLLHEWIQQAGLEPGAPTPPSKNVHAR